MLGYFPSFYPDELLYSTLARFSGHSGYLTYRYAAGDLFTDRTACPDMEFLNKLRPVAVDIICRNQTMEELILNHTMFPWYGRFLGKERRNKAFQGLIHMEGNYASLLSLPKQGTGRHYLRYCPLCAKEDRETHGETWWHRSHQLPGISVCPLHGCRLHNSSVMVSSKRSPAFLAAEQETRNPEVIWGSLQEQRLARFAGEVFWSNINLQKDVPIGKFLHDRLTGTEYLSTRGGQRKIQLLYENFKEFYKELPEACNLQLSQLHKIFTEYRHNPYEICLLAYFLKISPENLSEPKLPEKSQEQLFDEKVREMKRSGIGINEIARRLKVSSKTVRDVLKQENADRRKKCYKIKCGPKSKNWEQIDRDTLPLVEKAVKQLYGNHGDRPRKVTEYAVCKLLNLPGKRFEHLPFCRAEIAKYKETQEEYWARETVWAVRKLLSEGKTLNWKQFMVLTNMRKEYLVACLPILGERREANVIEFVEGMLSG